MDTFASEAQPTTRNGQLFNEPALVVRLIVASTGDVVDPAAAVPTESERDQAVVFGRAFGDEARHGAAFFDPPKRRSIVRARYDVRDGAVDEVVTGWRFSIDVQTLHLELLEDLARTWAVVGGGWYRPSPTNDFLPVGDLRIGQWSRWWPGQPDVPYDAAEQAVVELQPWSDKTDRALAKWIIEQHQRWPGG